MNIENKKILIHRHCMPVCVSREPIRSSEEGQMCPACIESTVVMVAGAGSAGGILAVCIDKFRNFFRVSSLSLFQKTRDRDKEK